MTKTRDYSRVRLGDVVQISPDSIGRAYPYNEIDYIDISSVGTGVLHGTTRCPLQDAPGRAKRLVSSGDTILSTVRPNRRSFLYIKKPSPQMVVSTGFAVLRPTEGIDSRFLYYSVTHQPFTDFLTANAKGAAYPAVDTETIARAEFALPPLLTQRKIAAVLSAYDDLIENNTRRIKILEEMARAIYGEWFVDFRFPGHEKVKMVDSPLGKMPEGWEISSVGDVLEYHIGGGWGQEEADAIHNQPAYVIRGTDIPRARHMGTDQCPRRYHKLSNYKARCLQAGDIIFEVSGGSKNQPLGRALLVSARLLRELGNDVVCASFCKLARVDKRKFKPELLYLHMLDIYENGRIGVYQVQSTGISNFKWQAFLGNEPFIVAPKAIQDAFTEAAAPLFEEARILGAKNANLRATRDLLLPELISGEIDVSELDIQTERPARMAANGGGSAT